MATVYIPSREADLLTWSTNFSVKIAASPGSIGLTAMQVTTLTQKHDAYASAYQTAKNPATRSPANVVAKNDAKADLIAGIRELAGIIQAFPGTTDVQRSTLGLTIRKTEPTPEPAPQVVPVIDVVSMDGHSMEVRLHDGSGTRRAKPDGVKGASVFSFVGEVAPTDINAWKFEGSTSKTETTIDFPLTLAPGTRVWVTAFWCNAKLESGPAATPVSAVIQFGGMSKAA